MAQQTVVVFAPDGRYGSIVVEADTHNAAQQLVTEQFGLVTMDADRGALNLYWQERRDANVAAVDAAYRALASGQHDGKQDTDRSWGLSYEEGG